MKEELLPESVRIRENLRVINNNKEINSILTSFSEEEFDFLKSFAFIKVKDKSFVAESLNFENSKEYNKDLSIIFVFCIEAMENYLSYEKFKPNIGTIKLKKGPYINKQIYTEEDMCLVSVEDKIKRLLRLFSDLKPLKGLCQGLNYINAFHYKYQIDKLVSRYSGSMVNLVNFLKSHTNMLDVEGIGSGSQGMASILDKLKSV